jgi:phospholipase/carboxylesterase
MLRTELIPAQRKDSRELLVVLHGLGDSMEGYRWLPDLLAMPNLNYLLVNAPDPYYGGFSWYDFASNPGPGVQRSRGALFTILDQYRAQGYPTEQCSLFGFSQGCLMTIDIGLRYSHRFASLVGISGYVFEPERLIEELSSVARDQRLLITHGTEDSLIPIDAVRGQMNILKSAGIDIQWREFVKSHTIAGEEEISVIRNFLRH